MVNLQVKGISGYAAAGYCSNHGLKNWDCDHCKVLGPGTQVKHMYYELYTGSRGFLSIDEIRKQIIVSFRDSIEIKNFVDGADMLLSPYSVGNSNTDICVHIVLKNTLPNILANFINELGTLLRERDNYKITITGYSSGASIGTLASIELKNTFNLSWDRMQLYIYGKSRVGNVAFAEWFNVQTLTIARVTNGRDFISYFPQVYLSMLTIIKRYF